MILISSCLLGEDCKYNGENNYNGQVEGLAKEYDHLAVCPEVLAGLEIPRPPAEIKAGTGYDVLTGDATVETETGEDVTKEFMQGAKETLKLAVENEARLAILKANSPSCGNKRIYDGSFSGELKEGSGVTAEMLQRAGVKIFNEGELGELKQLLDRVNNF